jgi:hypothetical protein
MIDEDRPPPRAMPSLDRLRARVRERVRATSLKRVARAVGMSPDALDRFLNRGMAVRGKSRAKMFHWLTRIQAEADVEAVTCAHYIQSLVAHMVPGDQVRAAAGIVEVLLRVHTSSKKQGVPLWLERLADVPTLFGEGPE